MIIRWGSGGLAGGNDGDIQINASGIAAGIPILPVSKGGTGTATPSIVAGTNITVTGTWPNQTISSTGGGGGGGSTPTPPGGANGQIQFNNSGVFGGIATTGSGSVVLATSPTLTTPNLGVPASGVLTNATGLPITTGTTGTLPTNRGGTGVTAPALVAGANVTITGTWPNQTIATTTGGTYFVDVTKAPYNAVGNDSTDNTAAIQAAIDANPLGDIFIPRSNGLGIYRVSGSLTLTNASGKNFQGNILSDGATIKFTTAGSSAATDANMQKGFIAYPRVNGSGGDTSGWSHDSGKAVMSGLRIDGPLNGASVYLANSIGFVIERNYFSNARYGLACESTINAQVYKNTFYNHSNAGVGWIYSNNPNVYYSTGFWNDSYTMISNSFAWGNVVGALAFILDYGSLSERNRLLIGNQGQGANDRSGTQFGYLGRAVLPNFTSNWFENVNNGFRIISTNANEGGAGFNLPLVTGAQPSGTFAVGTMPDAYSFGATFFNNYTHAANIAFQPDCNGIVIIGGNLTDNTITTDLLLTQGGKNCIDLGNRSSTASWIVNNSYGGYLDLQTLTGVKGFNASPTISSGFGTSPAISNYGNTFAFVVTVGSGGTANTGVINMGATAPNGWMVSVTNLTVAGTSFTKQTNWSTTTVTLSSFATATGAPVAWGAGDLLFCKAIAY